VDRFGLDSAGRAEILAKTMQRKSDQFVLANAAFVSRDSEPLRFVFSDPDGSRYRCCALGHVDAGEYAIARTDDAPRSGGLVLARESCIARGARGKCPTHDARVRVAGSDPNPTEHLARVFAGETRALQSLRPRGRNAVADQPSVLASRVHVDRPPPTSTSAQHAAPVVKGNREIGWRDCR